MKNKIFLKIALAAVVVQLIPAVAMQFSNEVNWSLSDFVIMASLLFVMGFLFVLVARGVDKTSHRVAVGAAFVVAFLYVWAELAVGVFTNWGS